MSQLTEEELKQQRLEAGRKKFEELKKKNKKKKSKKKTENVDDGKEVDETEISEKAEQPAVKDVEAEETPQLEAEDTYEVQGQIKVEKEGPTDIPEETKEAVEETSNKEDFANEFETLNEPAAVNEDEPMERDNEMEATVKAGVRQEDSAEKKIIGTSDEKEEPCVVEEPVKAEESVAEEPEEETNEAERDVPDLFENSGPSFMESIQQAKLDDEITQLKQRNEKLATENSSLQQQLEDLKKENKSLKLAKMDHLDQFETLQEQIKELESKLSRAKVDSSAAQSAYDQDDNLSLSPSPPYQRPQITTSFSQFNLNKNDSSLSLAELKARLNKWKGWNIDMSSWRSVGTGPVVEL